MVLRRRSRKETAMVVGKKKWRDVCKSYDKIELEFGIFERFPGILEGLFFNITAFLEAI